MEKVEMHSLQLTQITIWQRKIESSLQVVFWNERLKVDAIVAYRESRKYRERGGIKAKRAGSGGEGLGLIPTEG